MRLRGERLANWALAVWPAPQLSEEQRLTYQPARSRSKATAYALADHRQLASPVIRAVFDALDAGIRSLDPNVSQDILKLTIAYRAETYFVDIVPQAKRLRLSLNMPFPELDDPKGAEVPYAIGLIRQSLERQLEEGS